jgi:hypothetical protein
MQTYDSVIATDGTRGRGEGVGGTEDGTTRLDGVTTFPDHGGDGAGAHVYISHRQCCCSWEERGVYGRVVQAIRPGKKGLSDRSA